MQHGIEDFLDDRPIADPPQGQFAPPPGFANEVMVSDVLADQGYTCGYSGKWHMGEDKTPQHHFSYWYTMQGGSSRYQNPPMNFNGKVVNENGYLADLITGHALEFLEAQRPGRPFFLTVSHFNPHTPYEGHPQKYYDMYAATKFDSVGWLPAAPNALREKNYLTDIVGNIRKCAASVTALDDQVPPLLKKIQDKGCHDNTLIVFVGDNGYLLGRHGLWSKGEASNPYNMYEEVVNIPLLWVWPGKAPAQSVRSELVSFCDVMPTLCEATGAPVPSRNLCGRSFLPIAEGHLPDRKHPWQNQVFAHLRNTDMVRDKRFKLVSRNDDKGPNEFYDESADPRERVNQYDNPQYRTVRDQLAKDLARWKSKYSS